MGAVEELWDGLDATLEIGALLTWDEEGDVDADEAGAGVFELAVTGATETALVLGAADVVAFTVELAEEAEDAPVAFALVVAALCEDEGLLTTLVLCVCTLEDVELG